jgi:hypothetical protein
MRNGQNNNKRMRNRNNNNNNNNRNDSNRRGQNPMTRVYESNGPDIKIRGTASHIAEKYLQLARDARSSGDPVAAENYYQHAEHYFRMIAAAQEQFRQSQQQPFHRPEGEPREESFDGDDDDFQAQGEPGYGNREQTSYPPRDNQFQPREQQHHYNREQQPHYNREQQQPYPPREQPRPPQQGGGDGQGDVGGLPTFITGGAPQAQGGSHAQNGHEGQADRYPLHRRRRRHRGPRSELTGPQGGSEGNQPTPRPTNE